MRNYLTDFDHCDPEYAEHAHEITAELREKCPVAKSPEHGGFWVLSRYADVYQAARQTDSFSSAEGVTLPSFGNPVPSKPLECDPPLTQLYRAMLFPYFTPAAVKRYEPMIHATVTELINEFIERGTGDLAQDLAIPLPAIAICHIMNLPPDRVRDMVSWSNRCFEAQDPIAIQELLTFLGDALNDRLQSPQDDLLTTIVQSDIEGPIPFDEAVSTTLLVAAAGFETTGNALGHLFRHIGEDRDLQKRIASEPQVIPSVIEESLRYHTPLQGVARTVRKGATVEGAKLSDGDRVVLLWGSANRDEERFPNADRFDPDRHPNRHLAFGTGVHACLGAHLARAEMRIAVEEVVRRLPGYELRSTPPIAHRNFIRAQDHVPIVFPPGPVESGSAETGTPVNLNSGESR